MRAPLAAAVLEQVLERLRDLTLFDPMAASVRRPGLVHIEANVHVATVEGKTDDTVLDWAISRDSAI